MRIRNRGRPATWPDAGPAVTLPDGERICSMIVMVMLLLVAPAAQADQAAHQSGMDEVALTCINNDGTTECATTNQAPGIAVHMMRLAKAIGFGPLNDTVAGGFIINRPPNDAVAMGLIFRKPRQPKASGDMPIDGQQTAMVWMEKLWDAAALLIGPGAPEKAVAKEIGMRKPPEQVALMIWQRPDDAVAILLGPRAQQDKVAIKVAYERPRVVAFMKITRASGIRVFGHRAVTQGGQSNGIAPTFLS